MFKLAFKIFNDLYNNIKTENITKQHLSTQKVSVEAPIIEIHENYFKNLNKEIINNLKNESNESEIVDLSNIETIDLLIELYKRTL